VIRSNTAPIAATKAITQRAVDAIGTRARRRVILGFTAVGGVNCPIATSSGRALSRAAPQGAPGR